MSNLESVPTLLRVIANAETARTMKQDVIFTAAADLIDQYASINVLLEDVPGDSPLDKAPAQEMVPRISNTRRQGESCTMTHQEIIAGQDYRDGAIIGVKVSDRERSLTVGCFYWARVCVPGCMDDGEWQPVRFTGIDFSHNPTWDYIGGEAASGHHHVEVVEIGEVIVR